MREHSRARRDSTCPSSLRAGGTPLRMSGAHAYAEHIKDERPTKWWASLSGGSRIRTYDLWVMSPTSYLCSIPRCFVYVCKGSNFFIHLQIFRHLFSRIPFSFIIITCSTLYYTLKFFRRRFRHAPHTRLKSRTRQQFTPHFFCSKTCC